VIHSSFSTWNTCMFLVHAIVIIGYHYELQHKLCRLTVLPYYAMPWLDATKWNTKNTPVRNSIISFYWIIFVVMFSSWLLNLKKKKNKYLPQHLWATTATCRNDKLIAKFSIGMIGPNGVISIRISEKFKICRYG
jgi:hypothetical protein